MMVSDEIGDRKSASLGGDLPKEVLARMAKATDRDLLIELRKARSDQERIIREEYVRQMKLRSAPAWLRKAFLTSKRDEIRARASAFVDAHKSDFMARARAERQKATEGAV